MKLIDENGNDVIPDAEFVCTDCEKTFVEPKHYVERHGFDHPPYEEWDGCPYCGCTWYVPIQRCDACFGVILGDYVVIPSTGERYCSKCYKTATI